MGPGWSDSIIPQNAAPIAQKRPKYMDFEGQILMDNPVTDLPRKGSVGLHRQ